MYGELLIDSVSAKVGRFSIEDIGLSVGMGEVVGLLGHNGAGKSTTFRVISDLVRPTFGSVWFGDRNHRINERAFKRCVAFIGDNQNIYKSMRVHEAIAFARRFYTTWDDTWCAQSCVRLRLPTDTRVGHLSTGMRAKLALILGFAFQPKIVIMDEATSNLDVDSREWFWEYIESQVSAGTLGVLISSHSRAEIVHRCDRAIILEDGLICAEMDLKGDPETLDSQLVMLLGMERSA
ncbi:MAG: hypothetical protein B5766_02885 [Candidatus Lumbricidophila eiseniae]|uniref:ABC transporter domain-containing protein n=1 Tax=Candidatus Lumbricidiphila eiseniae TaxID=1969409 RepID=A0A2A6FTW2_9MICO|nr:MAG: hypothetical protein B5766_02885 [Candidatus Lumbricidophila eiseniae]